jgi:Ca-activated chloride channel family protein
MEYLLRCAYPTVLYILVPGVALCAWMRWKFYKGTRYRYPLTTVLKTEGFVVRSYRKPVLACMRLATLLILAVLLAKPRFIDPRTHVHVEGIDIVVVLDVSGSMSFPHHTDDKRSRLEVAKTEAIRFIEKRTNDAIGLVIFGNDALSRCPLTVDKNMLKEAVGELEIGVVNHEGTVLAQSIITAATRLKQSKAKSKVMIVLTDGAPSENDANPKVAIEIAKKLGIKIYTIGIGDHEPVTMYHPFYGNVHIKSTLNKPLLTMIAQETGGHFFEAKNASDMRAIYETIDALEKTELQAPVFNNYHDWFMPLVWLAIALLLVELVLTSFVWFGL